jgi:hypothetical protein
LEDYRFLEAIKKIEPDNRFLDYIVNRVIRDDYRGIQVSQHNRLTLEYCRIILEVINELAGDDLLNVHIGDDNGEQQPQAKKYYKLVELVSSRSGKGTVNSIKKNTFPDIAKMGLIERYNIGGEIIDESGSNRSVIKSVRLSKLGKELISSDSFTQIRIWTEGVDRLLGRLPSELAEILHMNDLGIDQISIIEFMYIISDEREEISCIDKTQMIFEYRKLNDRQKNQLHENMKRFCNPDNRRRNANKTLLRDYSNWKNESQQIFGLLSNSSYFRVQNDILVLNYGDTGIFNTSIQRGEKAKRDYFNKHRIEKTTNFQLHHIVPISNAKNQNDMLDIDNFKNLVYLSSTIHKSFPRRDNKYVKLFYSNDKKRLTFTNFRDQAITAEICQEVLLKKSFLPHMTEHNRFLLKKYFQYKD